MTKCDVDEGNEGEESQEMELHYAVVSDSLSRLAVRFKVLATNGELLGV
jgi:hypothetical protein